MTSRTLALHLQALSCTIERRLLVNYRIDPDVVAAQLPAPFRPQVVSGWAVGGVCFLRLAAIRPAGLPARLGVTTENVAHRFAVEWDDADGRQVGVYVPRRDTNSRLSSWLGDRLFPGQYHRARFAVDDRRSELHIGVTSRDGVVDLAVSARPSPTLGGSLFGSADEAIDFFRRGSLGFSPGAAAGCFDGVRLASQSWAAAPASVDSMASSLFDDLDRFPRGSCTLDSALVMRDLPVQWVSEGGLESRGRAAAGTGART